MQFRAANALFICNEDAKNAVATNAIHVRIDPSVKEIHMNAFRGLLGAVVRSTAEFPIY